VVRDLRAMPGLTDALRITVGTPEQNTRLLGVIASLSVPAGAAA
jgi:histidinol-phosphate aminotransferase